MAGVATCLWFDGQAEEAAKFYVAAFRAVGREASLGPAMRHTSAGPGPEGGVLLQTFTLEGHDLQGLNGGPEFQFSPATSLSVTCETQAEVDHFWNTFAQGGETSQCGWVTDRYGFSWQVVPRVLIELLMGADKPRAARVMTAMMGMTKLDIAAIEAA